MRCENKVYCEDVLWRAWIAVRRNNGAPGTGKTTLADVEEYGVTRLLGELAAELRAGRWRPMPARQVLIPKPGNTGRRWATQPAVSGACGQVTQVFGTHNLIAVLREYEDFYNTHRPHRALNQAAPLRPLPDSVTDLDHFRVQRRDRAGGVIHDYRPVA